MKVLCVTLGLIIRTIIAGLSYGTEGPSREVLDHLRDELSILHGTYTEGNYGGPNLKGEISLVDQIGGPSSHTFWHDDLGFSMRPVGLSNNYLKDLEFEIPNHHLNLDEIDSIQRLFEFEDDERHFPEEILSRDKLEASTSRHGFEAGYPTTEKQSESEQERNEAERLNHMTLDAIEDGSVRPSTSAHHFHLCMKGIRCALPLRHSDGSSTIEASSEPPFTEESMKKTSENLKLLKDYTGENLKLSKALIVNNLKLSSKLLNANKLFLKKIQKTGSKVDLTKIDLNFVKELTDIGLKDFNSFTKGHHKITEEIADNNLLLSVSLNTIRLKMLQRIYEKRLMHEIPEPSNQLTHENLSRLERLAQENAAVTKKLVESNIDFFRALTQSQMNLLDTLEHHDKVDKPNSFSSRIHRKPTRRDHQGILKRKSENIAVDGSRQVRSSGSSTLSEPVKERKQR